MHPLVQAEVGGAAVGEAAEWGGFCGGMGRHILSGGLLLGLE